MEGERDKPRFAWSPVRPLVQLPSTGMTSDNAVGADEDAPPSARQRIPGASQRFPHLWVRLGGGPAPSAPQADVAGLGRDAIEWLHQMLQSLPLRRESPVLCAARRTSRVPRRTLFFSTGSSSTTKWRPCPFPRLGILRSCRCRREAVTTLSLARETGAGATNPAESVFVVR